MSENQTPPRRGGHGASAAASAGRVGLWLAVYFVLIAAARVLVSDSAELDESEQVVLTQFMRWGYVAQPPLYTWLQGLLFGALGTQVAALAALKAVLMWGTCMFVYHAVAAVTEAARPAVVAAVSVFFIPQFLWESQRDLTHSVLVTAAAAATLVVFLRLLKSRRPVDYCLFGLCAGLGMLSKYNYALFVIPLLLASCSLSWGRPVVVSRWMLASLGIFSATTLAHWIWVAGHFDMVVSQAPAVPLAFNSGRLDIEWNSALNLAQCVGAFVGPLVAVYLAVFSRAPSREVPAADTASTRALIGRTLIAGLLLCLGLALVYPVGFKDRWLQPLLFTTPIYLALLVERRLDATRTRLLVSLATVAAVVVLIVLPAIPWFAALTGRPTRLNAPYAELARQLAARDMPHRVILADSYLPAGNLKLLFPQSTVLAPEGPGFPVPRNTPWLVVWDATAEKDPPPALRQHLTRLLDRAPDLSGARYVEAPLQHLESQSMRLGYVTLIP